MSTAEAIIERLKSLPDSAQREVLDFIEFLAARRAESDAREEDLAWSRLSLGTAMRGMEDEEELYTLDDLKERFR
jgi:hypothetical protein